MFCVCLCQKDNQVSVLAGSGPDDSRVAFVKTVRPGAEVNQRGDDLRNVSFEDETFEVYLSIIS